MGLLMSCAVQRTKVFGSVTLCHCMTPEVAELAVVVIAHAENQEKVSLTLGEVIQVCKALTGVSISFIVQIFY